MSYLFVIIFVIVQIIFFFNAGAFTFFVIAYLFKRNKLQEGYFLNSTEKLTAKSVLIIVPVCNENKVVIERFIKHYKTFLNKMYDIVIVENSSNNKYKSDAVEYLTKNKIKFVSIDNYKNKGKALNYALKNYDFLFKGYTYFLFLDIDQLPDYQDVSRPVSLLVRDKEIIAVQFREAFDQFSSWNWCYACIQSVFTDVLCIARSYMNTAILLGGNFIIKSNELYELGLFADNTIMEDVATTLVLNSKGKNVIYFDHYTCT